MSSPKPLSDDWFSWNPETIHRYPEPEDSADTAGVDSQVHEPVIETARRVPAGKTITRALLRDVAAGVVSGLVAAVLLTLVIAFFPGAARATQAPPALADTELTHFASRDHASEPALVRDAIHERNVEYFSVRVPHELAEECFKPGSASVAVAGPHFGIPRASVPRLGGATFGGRRP
jgi:hypothetical protein